MEKELNLVEILKDCPKGTKLYSTIHGEVEFEKIIIDDTFPIKFTFKVEGKNSNSIYAASVSIDGKYATKYNGECILFPSKDQRDWSKFKVEPEMVDGEFYYCCYSHNKKENSFIFIYKKHLLYKTKCYVALNPCISVLFENDLITNNNENLTELRKATVEEKQQLLDFIKIKNYEWDADKKVLIKIEPKFNISSFQPFDKVLVRDCDAYKWRCDFFESYIKGADLPFHTLNSWYKQCIPYNNETKHLVDTKKMPPKKYINWEE